MRLTVTPPLLIALPLLAAATLAPPVAAQGGATAAPAQTTAAAAKETYESAMRTGDEAKRKAASQTGAEADKTLDSARDAYIRAAGLAPDSVKKAEAYVASGDVQAGRGLWLRAVTDYNFAAMQKGLPPAVLIRATMAEANASYQYRRQEGTLRANAFGVRQVYDRALKIPELSAAQRLEAQQRLAELFVLENRPAESAREYEKLSQLQARDRESSLQSLRLAAWYAGAEQKGKMGTSAMPYSEAGGLIDHIFGQLIGREHAARKSTLQLEWLQALMAYNNPERALAVLVVIKDEALMPLAVRRATIRQIIQQQTASPEKALLSWDELRKLPGNTSSDLIQIATSRADLFRKLNKEPEVRGEYQALLAQNPRAEEKANAWYRIGLSWNRQREARPDTATADRQSDTASAQAAFEAAWNMTLVPIGKRVDALIERANIESGAKREPAAREWLQKGIADLAIDPANKQRLLYLVARSYGVEKKHPESLASYQAALAIPVTVYKTDIGKSLTEAVGTAFRERDWDAARNYLAEVEKNGLGNPAGNLYDRANIENQAGNKEAALAALTQLENTYGAQLNPNDKTVVANLRKQIEPPAGN